jgi:hypothetical protein
MWITGLISTLVNEGIPTQFIHTAQNYLTNTAFTVVHGASESTRRPTQARVAQGPGPATYHLQNNTTVWMFQSMLMIRMSLFGQAACNGLLKNYTTKMAVFWVVAPCSLLEVYRRFTGVCCLHHQSDE